MADGLLALNPLSYWALDASTGTTGVNAKAGGLSATLRNGAAFAADGAKGRGVRLDGINDIVSVNHAAAYATPNGAISVWFKPDALGTVQGIVSKDSTGLDAGGGFTALLQADGSIQFTLESAASSFSITSSALAAASAWNNLMISWGAGGMQVWLNGALVGTDAYTGGLVGSDDPLVFGASAADAADTALTGLTNYFKGGIDEAVVFTRQPTAAEVSAIYLNGSVQGNANPVAANDAAGLSENGTPTVSGNVIANDTDANADALIVFAVQGNTASVGAALAGTYGVLTLNADGTYTYALNATAANVEALRAGQTVTETFVYTASDGKGGLSTANLVVTIVGENDAPVLVAEVRTTNEDGTTSLTGNVLSNDKDLDGGSLVVTAVNGAAGGVGASVSGTYGAILISANGAYTYSLANASLAVQSLKAGQVVTDTFAYSVSDGQGGTSATTISVSITGRNDAPVVLADAGAATPGSAPIATGNVLANDSDIDGDVLSVSAVKGLAANVGVNVAGTYGVLRINADGSYTYTVNAAAANVIALRPGQSVVDTFAYTASDGTASASANLVITVNGVNDAPTAVNDLRTITEDPTTTSLTGNVLTNDTDPDGGTLAVTAVNGNAGLVGAGVSGAYGTLSIAAGGAYTYTLANASPAVQSLKLGQSVTDVFTYTVADGQGGSTTASVVITVTGKNDAPTLTADTGALDLAATTSTTGNVLTNDTDIDGDLLAVSAVKGVAANVGADVAGVYGTLRLNADGSYVYTANQTLAATIALRPGQVAVDTFAYTARDANNATASSTLAISVTGVNDGPRAVNDARAITEDPASVTLTGNLLTNDSDPDGGVLSVTAVNGASGGVGATITGAYGSLIVGTNGAYTYTLANSSAAVQALRAGQAATDTFSYTIADGQGGSGTASLIVTVTGKNDTPTVFAVATASVTEDVATLAAGNVLASLRDVDVGDTLAVNQVKGLAANVGVAVAGTYGSIVINADGTYAYTLNNAAANVQALNEGQVVTDTFTFRANDGSGANVSNSIVVTILGRAEHPPVAVADVFAGVEDTTATFDVRLNDTDIDNDALSVTHIAGRAVGSGQSVVLTGGHTATLNADGTISLTPAANINGAVTFGYTISDGHGGSSSSTVTVNLAPVADQATIVFPSGALTPLDAGDVKINAVGGGREVVSSVLALPDGGYVIAWSTFGEKNTHMQLFDAAGGKVGPITQVNTSQSFYEWEPSIALITDGFVIAWQSEPGTRTLTAQRFGLDGTKLGGEFPVAPSGGRKDGPVLTGLPDGGFVAVWYAEGQDGSGFGIYGQRYSAAGARVGGEVRLNEITLSDQVTPSVALTASGGLVVSWVSTHSDGGDIVARQFDANLNALTGDIPVNASTGSTQFYPAVAALASGEFVVTWSSVNGEDGDGWGNFMRRFAVDGTPLTGDVQVNTYTAGVQRQPSIIALPDGGYLISWTSYGQDGSGGGIYAQRYDASGAPVGTETRLNAETSGSQFNDVNQGGHELALTPAGVLIQVFVTDDNDLYARRFDTRMSGPVVENATSPLPLSIFAFSGETVTATVLSGLPAGSVLSAGTANGDGTVWTFAGAPPANLSLTPPANYNGSFTLTVTATTQEGSSTATTSATTSVTVAPVASPPLIAFGNLEPVQPADTQVGSGSYGLASIARTGDGFTVLHSAPDAAVLYLQRHGADGTPSGSEQLVTTSPGHVARSASIAGLADGGSVVVWADTSSGNFGSSDIRAQRFDAAGDPVGGSFQASSVHGNLRTANAVGLDGGGFAVTWSGEGTYGPGWFITTQVFNADGSPRGGELVANTSIASEVGVRIAARSGGGFIVAWSSPGVDGQDVYARVFDASGNAVGGEIHGNTTTAGDQNWTSVVALANGQFVLSWASPASDGSGYDILAQRFDAGANPVGGEFLVNTFHPGNQVQPMMTALATGGFLVSWTSQGQDGSGSGIFAQEFNANGARAGSEFRINATAAGEQYVDTNPGGPQLVGLDGGLVAQVFLDGGGNTYVRQFAPTAFSDPDGDHVIQLPITIAAGTAGESITQVVLSGLPEGSVLSAGLSNVDGTAWTFAGPPPANLTLTAPAGFEGAFTLTVTATEADGAATALATATRLVVVSEAASFAMRAAPDDDQALLQSLFSSAPDNSQAGFGAAGISQHEDVYDPVVELAPNLALTGLHEADLLLG